MKRNDEPAIQLEDGSLGCPQCRVRLTSGKSCVFVDGLNIGAYESIRCEFCGFFLLTAEGFDNTKPAIDAYGLVVPDEHIVVKQEPVLKGQSTDSISTHEGKDPVDNPLILPAMQSMGEIALRATSGSPHSRQVAESPKAELSPNHIVFAKDTRILMKR